MLSIGAAPPLGVYYVVLIDASRRGTAALRDMLDIWRISCAVAVHAPRDHPLIAFF
jgi:hypothetical protein